MVIHRRGWLPIALGAILVTTAPAQADPKMGIAQDPASGVAIENYQWGTSDSGLYVYVRLRNTGKKTLKEVMLQVVTIGTDSARTFDHVFTAFPSGWRTVFAPGEGVAEPIDLSAVNAALFGPNAPFPVDIFLRIQSTTATDGTVWTAQPLGPTINVR